jgi:hypothetical protein
MSKLSVHETEQENENAGSPTLQHLRNFLELGIAAAR